MTKLILVLGSAVGFIIACPTYAHENEQIGPHAMDHAPIGVMTDHRHEKGKWMLSYRFMNMDMQGTRSGQNSLNPDEIVTTVPNRFFGTPGQPRTLRVVSTDMQMNMHMVGAMVGLSDRITLMGMISYNSKDMTHLTYQGGIGANLLGTFETSTEGFGDTTIGAIFGLDNGLSKSHQINLNLSVNIPTGSNTETGQILTPMGSTPSPRLPYPMQLGTGTYDIIPKVTYFDRSGKFGWGSQVGARVALDKNDEGYKYGDQFNGTAWLSYEPKYWISLSARLNAQTQDRISGIDASILAPVQTADPLNFGGDNLEAFIGINLVGQSGAIEGHRLSIEYGIPIYRNLNGPQLERDSAIAIGWQKAL